ncbi:arsenate reductase ArsC [Methanolobus sediminis]|uniref:Arsenate reductase ArsC n=1 Tax=Methanolobus sediminis TaxID=3072978 RepID=A0AA51YMB9_9EURY|nr:arsenate reductase ArsC [Methanolobus sediminis]WMW25844.1 arsenate reductase ArsC [Methanolobus sediminis]
MEIIEKQDKKKILFVCYHNSARSQMAEGLMRSIYGDGYDVYSAGVEATAVDPRAIQVMREINIDISGQRSKTLSEYQDIVFDVLVTVCDKAKQACPVCSTPELASVNVRSDEPRAKKLMHRSFKDPVAATGSNTEQLEIFRQIRDEIREWITVAFRAE